MMSLVNGSILKTDLGWILKELRRKNNETLRDMADNLGISISCLSNCENGSVTNRMYSVIMSRVLEKYISNNIEIT